MADEWTEEVTQYLERTAEDVCLDLKDNLRNTLELYTDLSTRKIAQILDSLFDSYEAQCLAATFAEAFGRYCEDYDRLQNKESECPLV